MKAFEAFIGRHGSYALPWRSLGLAGIAVALFWLAGPAPEALVYDREALTDGEYWRLVTGHLVHSDTEHVLWDIAALVLLGGLFEQRLGRWLLPVLAGAALAIDCWLYWLLPEVSLYCGLSGVLNGMLAAGLLLMWNDRNDLVVLLVAAGAVSKIVVETANGGALFTDTLWPSLPIVHGVGFAAGLAVVLLRLWSARLELPGQRS
jgi:rhomboid family GlyGly-CTERM serine protease